MAHTPNIPGVTVARWEVEYEVTYNGDTAGWVKWEAVNPKQWTADHFGSFPGKKVFTGTRARAQAIRWVVKQEKAGLAEAAA